LHRLDRREIGRDDLGAAAERAGFLDRFLSRSTADRGDIGTGFGQCQRDRLADAGIGAGDDGDFAGKIEGVGHFYSKFPSRLREGLGEGLSRSVGSGNTPSPSPSRKREGS